MIMKIKEKLEELKDKSIRNVNKYFYQSILEDYYEAGFEGIDYLITQDDWYEYWLGIRFQIQRLRGDILHDFSNLDVEIDELLIELIEIQSIVDRELIDNCSSQESEDQIMIDLGHSQKANENNRIEFKGQNQKDIAQLVYNYLSENNLIKCTEDEFIKTLIEPSDRKIKWYGKQKLLMCLFKLLESKITINSNTTISKLICDRFELESRQLKKRSVEVQYSDLVKDFINSDHILNNLKNEINSI